MEELKEKYKKIGGRSPLKEIVFSQAKKLEEMLGNEYKVFVGMKYSKPFIEDAVVEMRKKNIGRAVAIPLSPFYSEFSISEYFKRIDKVKGDIEFVYIKGFSQYPDFLKLICEKIEEKIKEFKEKNKIFYIFTAHSLLLNFMHKDDPYEKSIKESALKISEMLNLRNFRIAYQGIPSNSRNWLLPSLEDAISEAK